MEPNRVQIAGRLVTETAVVGDAGDEEVSFIVEALDGHALLLRIRGRGQAAESVMAARETRLLKGQVVEVSGSLRREPDSKELYILADSLAFHDRD